MIFDADDFATAWLSVAYAASDDKSRPVLCKTVLVEEYSHGVQLISTDSYMLLRAWVPVLEHDWDPPPTLDDAPMRATIVSDPDGRGKALLQYCRQLAARARKKPGVEPPDLRVEVGVKYIDPDAAAPTFEGLEPLWVKFDLPDAEQVRLQIVDAEYPTWRTLVGDVDAQETKHVALNPEILSRLVKVSNLHDGKAWQWEWCGEIRPAIVSVRESDPHISGLVMPCRWDLDEDAPYVDPTPSDDEMDGQQDIDDIDDADDGTPDNVVPIGGDRS